MIRWASGIAIISRRTVAFPTSKEDGSWQAVEKIAGCHLLPPTIRHTVCKLELSTTKEPRFIFSSRTTPELPEAIQCPIPMTRETKQQTKGLRRTRTDPSRRRGYPYSMLPKHPGDTQDAQSTCTSFPRHCMDRRSLHSDTEPLN